MEELMKPIDAAKLLNVDQTTLMRWHDKGIITAIRTPGGHRRYYRREINDIRNGVHTPTCTVCGMKHEKGVH